MDCFDLPDDVVLQQAHREGQPLAVDSASIAFVDPANVVGFLAAYKDLLDSSDWLGPAGFACVGRGFVCDAGSDGLFPFSAQVRDQAVHSIEVCIDDWNGEQDRWVPAGVLPSPSGTLLLVTPGSSTSMCRIRLSHRLRLTACGR